VAGKQSGSAAQHNRDSDDSFKRTPVAAAAAVTAAATGR